MANTPQTPQSAGDAKVLENVNKPEAYFVLKQNADDEGEYVQAFEYPFLALGGLPLVGDLIKFEDNNTYRVYLRSFDYSEIKKIIKIYFYMIRVAE